MSSHDSKTPHSLWSDLRKGPLRVAIVGSGNWGSAIARVVGQNTANTFFFEKDVKMWVYEEQYEGKKLTEIINTTHENKKYLPGIKLPENIIACPDVKETVKGAHILVFVTPHQFIESICKQLRGHILTTAKAISLVKGFEVSSHRIHLISEYVQEILEIDCCALSGANVADDVAKEQFAETTIGYGDIESATIFQRLFDTPYFRVNCVPGAAAVELCGALKNVIALAAGFSDGLGLGTNTKSALLRIGMDEMRRFASAFYKDINDEAFWDSCGMADLITTCFSGRNRKCAEQFVKTGKSWATLEKELLQGQKLQGTHTTRDIVGFLKTQGRLSEFPLFATIYDVVEGDSPPSRIVTAFMGTEPRPIVVRRAKL